jgi:hypothetical protein
VWASPTVSAAAADSLLAGDRSGGGSWGSGKGTALQEKGSEKAAAGRT